MFEIIENIGGALVYHGNMHKRIYFSENDNVDLDKLLLKMKDLAKKKQYEKILGKASEKGVNVLRSKGFTVEAKIPGLYNGTIDGYFLAEYTNEERHSNDERISKTIATVKTIAKAANKANSDSHFQMPDELTINKLSTVDFDTLEDLHKKAYKYHPHQIKNADYFSKLKDLNHQYYGLFQNGELLVSAILAVNSREYNVEIVDFVTHPDYRGQNLSYFLVQDIKKRMDKLGCKTIYTMVRSTSYGLNITFSKHGFILAGTLTNNCMVRDSMESMNVWYFKNDQS
ncbi:putative beta-lysine N-acetyltransferase [Maribacter hydrothermalis]|uniref:Putative beta-lysine N-acetyltransferase n=1 Tax=Maribacter hydrothermalis TaxID=1836467 RepID=A0A1B7YXY9_9FLAO|nr:putative beta-lysine N-acetyltransferase [Maribacter hydrothermalis]APQ16818.1 putative beta-lysine N-acetyltransferase [Maribacter hydrothermalis]OBR35246.1 putative beta-lysine N-acetyltransferase [Maribacter hydrothermalis]